MASASNDPRLTPDGWWTAANRERESLDLQIRKLPIPFAEIEQLLARVRMLMDFADRARGKQ